MKERRRYVRHNRKLEVSFQIPKQLFKHGSHSIDISIQGVRFPILQKLKTGTTLELEVRSIEIEKPITATGEIVWVNKKNDEKYPFEVGVKFINITPPNLKALNYVFKVLKEKDSRDIKWID